MSGKKNTVVHGYDKEFQEKSVMQNVTRLLMWYDEELQETHECYARMWNERSVLANEYKVREKAYHDLRVKFAITVVAFVVIIIVIICSANIW